MTTPKSEAASYLYHWDRERRAGNSVTAEQLCANAPEDLESVKQQIAAVEALERVLGSGVTIDGGIKPPSDSTNTRLPTHQTFDPAEPTQPERANAPTHYYAPPGYEFISELGRGGMGVVFKARDLKLNRVVAVKMVLGGSLAGSSALVRFLSEAEALAALQHPNVVQVYDRGQHQGLPYFVMEYCPGGSLTEKVRDNPLTARAAAELVEQLSRGVAAAHVSKNLHRDLKPDNVLFGTDGLPKIADFGLAKHYESSESETLATGLTQSGAIMGTPSYMAPEQAMGERKRIGPATDVYSLGAIFYRVITGRPPFVGANSADTIRQVIDDEPLSPTELVPTLPRDLCTICLKCLHKEPDRRFVSASELADDLRRYLDGLPILARPVGRIERTVKWVKRNPVVTGATLAVALALAVGSAVGYWNYRDASERATEAANARNAETERVKERDAALDKATNARNAVAERVKERDAALDKMNDALKHSVQELYAADSNIALQSFEAGQLGRTRQFLAQYTPKNLGDRDFRGFEWFYLDRLCRTELSAMMVSQYQCSALAAFPDGQQFAIAHGAEARVYERDRGSMTANMRGHTLSITALACDPKGERLASSSNDKTVRIWETKSGKLLHTLKGHTEPVRYVTFSPDGKMIVSCAGSREYPGKQCETIIWNLEKEEPAHTLREHQGAINGVAFSNDGKLLASCSHDGTLQLYDPPTGKHVREIRVNRGALAVAFHPKGKTIAASTTNGAVVICDLESGKMLRELHGHVDWTHSLSFSDDGMYLASGGQDGIIRIWNPDNGQLFRSLRGHAGSIAAVRFKPRSLMLVSTGDDGYVRHWHAGQNVEYRRLTSESTSMAGAFLTPDGKRLLVVSYNGTTITRDASTGEGLPLSWPVANDERALGAALFPDGDTFLLNLQAGPRFLSISGKTITPPEGFKNVYRFTVSPDGKWIAATHNDGSFRVYEFGGKSPPQTIAVFSSPLTAFSIGPGAEPLLAMATQDMKVVLVKVANGERSELASKTPEHVRQFQFSRDGRTLAGAGQQSRVWLWDVASRKELWCREAHAGMVESIAFSADGDRIVTGSADRTAKVFDTVTGRETITLRGHMRSVERAFFTSDGAGIYTVGQESNIFVWDARDSARRERSRSFVTNCRIANPRVDKHPKAGAEFKLTFDVVNRTKHPLRVPTPGIPVRGLSVYVHAQPLGSNAPKHSYLSGGSSFVFENDLAPGSGKFGLSMPVQSQDWPAGRYRLTISQFWHDDIGQSSLVHSEEMEIELK